MIAINTHTSTLLIEMKCILVNIHDWNVNYNLEQIKYTLSLPSVPLLQIPIKLWKIILSDTIYNILLKSETFRLCVND